MKYTVYKIKNSINNKIYIGVHKRNKPDNYKGSGPAILKAIKKYGTKNFSKEILYTVDNEELAYFIEETIVDKIFISKKSNYNICEGGKGGYKSFHTESANKKRKETNLKKYGNTSGKFLTKESRKLAMINSQNTKLKLYGNKMGKAINKESRDKQFSTKIKKYGDKMGQCHTKEVNEKALKTKKFNYINNNPELNIVVEFRCPKGSLLIKDNLYEVISFMYTTRNVGTYIKDVIKKLNSGNLKYNARSIWKSHYFVIK